MNDIFDFGRFGKLLKYECVNYLSRYVRGMVVFASFFVALWLFTIAFEIPFNSRTLLVYAVFNLAIFLAPFFVYSDINDRKRGYTYAMMPASTFEKMLSMTLVCLLIIPLMVYATLSLTDLLLYGLSCAGVGYFTGFELCNPFVLDWGVLDPTDSFKTFFDAKISALNSISAVTTYMMFNAIFRKYKIIKTILFNMAVSFTLQIIMVFVAVFATAGFMDSIITFFEELFSKYTPEEMLAFYHTMTMLWYIAVTATTLVITYFRIKRVNY